MRILVTGLGTFWGSRLAQYLEAQPTGVKDRHPVTHFCDVGQRVRGEENRMAGATQGLQLSFEESARLRIETSRRLVEHVELFAG